jgi:anthranilate synthase/aminodeoxychorismate synthase-like glutamine amidotransferase
VVTPRGRISEIKRKLMALLMIDNYDSFTYNLVQYFQILGQEVCVFRNDKVTMEELEKLRGIQYLVISPGPCTPNESGISIDAIDHFKGKIPILGVCLGHQAIGAYFGCTVVRADLPMHGKNSDIFHDGMGIYSGIKNPFSATRYHSLVISEESFSDELVVTARTRDNVIMGVRCRNYPVEGVQFHPEAILTTDGMQLLANFLKQPSVS